jgi:P27 family predicted phage terminase small subunit
MAGRPPKPTAQKRLEGNPGKRALKDGPAMDATRPTCPRWLSADARKEWHRVCKQLGDAGILKNVDRAILAAYCTAWARWQEAEEHVQKEGQVVTSSNGNPYMNPWLSAAQAALRDMKQLASELGMTPSGRGRIKPDMPDKQLSLADMLFAAAKEAE